MYVSPLAGAKVNTPTSYTIKARDEINKKLNSGVSSNLKYGSSPLKNVASTAADLSKVDSNDSIDSQTSEMDNNTKRHKSKFFGLAKLKQMTSNNHNNSNIHVPKSINEEQDSEMLDDDSSIIDTLAINHLQPLQTVPSIASTDSQYSNMSYASTQPSIQSNYTAANSLFSHQNSVTTQFSNYSIPTNYNHPLIPQQEQQEDLRSTKQVVITLSEALPTNFNDMYAPELLADPALLIDGRPMFTKRVLLDWELNDVRSLLIVEKLRPEWNNKLPLIYSPQGFQMILLPLDSDDQTIVETLVKSDIYKEANFDDSFRIQTAKYTLYTARARHAQILKNSGLPVIYNNRLSKPEWRNVIENFTLNLAVEAQCRHDFKKACHALKKSKKLSTSPAPAAATNSLKFGQNSLLRKAIMNEASQSNKKNLPSVEYKLSKEEKAELWRDVQSKVYHRLGLDWTPDSI